MTVAKYNDVNKHTLELVELKGVGFCCWICEPCDGKTVILDLSLEDWLNGQQSRALLLMITLEN